MSGTQKERDAPSQRIDKWLWCARRFKTRSLAAKIVSEGGVRVTREGTTQRVAKPAFTLRKGDQVSYLSGERIVVLTVKGFAERRGSPEASKALYSDPSACTAAR